MASYAMNALRLRTSGRSHSGRARLLNRQLKQDRRSARFKSASQFFSLEDAPFIEDISEPVVSVNGGITVRSGIV